MSIPKRLALPRILVVHNAYQQKGGEDRVVEDEIKLLRDYGHSVELFSRDNSSIKQADALSLFANTIWSRGAAKEFEDTLRSFQPDIVHVHNTFPLISPSIYWAAYEADVPVVQTLHNFRLLCAQAMLLRNDSVCEDCLGKFPWRGVVRRCYRDSMAQSAAVVTMLGVHRAMGTYRRKVTRYIALSEFARSKFIESGQFDKSEVSIKPNFVDIEFSSPDRPRAGGVMVGRLSREKGAHVLAAACTSASDTHIDVIGIGPEQEVFAGLKNISVLGWCEKSFILERLCVADFLVVPSICYENFPRTVVEAFACGVPVIASRLGSLAEIIQDGYNGLLFTPGSATELAEKINWAKAHPGAMRDMGRNALQTYQSKYTADKNYVQLTEIYRAAIDATVGRRTVAEMPIRI